jgi:hypothetical protein
MNNRFYLNEEEKKRILQMHKPKLSQKIIEEQSLQDIQNIILDNGGYVGKLGADNRLGPDTLNAIYNSLTKGFAKNNTATAGTSQVAGTQPTGTQPTGTQGTETPAGTNPTGTQPTGTPAGTAEMPLKTLSTSGMTVQNNVANQQLATGPLKSGQEIRQDYRQQQRQERQGARQDRKNTKNMEQELSNLEGTYKRLQGKMTPSQKMGYETQIAQLKKDLGR